MKSIYSWQGYYSQPCINKDQQMHSRAMGYTEWMVLCSFFSTSALTNLLRYTWNREEEAGKFSDYFPFKLLCGLWNDCLHARYYTVLNVWTALKYNSTFGCQWLYENVNVYFNRHVFHCHPTPHTQPIFDPVRRALTRSNRHPLFPTFFLFSAVLVWQHWQRHTPTLFWS